jgi:hypothetical protein
MLCFAAHRGATPGAYGERERNEAGSIAPNHDPTPCPPPTRVTDLSASTSNGNLRDFPCTAFVAFHFEPVTEQLAVELVVFDDEDAVFQVFSKDGEVTTRSNCLINCSHQEFCFRKSDSACARTYFPSSLVRSLLVRTNTGRSAVRGLLVEASAHGSPCCRPREPLTRQPKSPAHSLVNRPTTHALLLPT